MSTERHLLFGILAFQNGFLTRDQLLTAVDLWLQDKSQNIDQILLDNHSLSADEARLLNELMNQLLLKQDEHATIHHTIGSDTESLLTELRGRNDQDIFNTIGPDTAPSPVGGTYPLKSDHVDGPRFKILRPHDEGGLGKVSVALDTELDREVALKEIKPLYADDPVSRSRFILEAEITGGLEHPGIVPIYGLGTAADGRPYYAMRFIKGDNLATAIEQYHNSTDEAYHTVGIRRLLGRFLDVCNAVYYAHQRGVLHRDLKPGNVMLGEYGETLVVDWGLAKPIDQTKSQNNSDESIGYREAPLKPRSESGVDATQLGSAIGSPHYMSPEQARGEHDRLGIAADVYSLGATLYTLLTNRKPVEGNSVQEILENVQFGIRKTAREQNPSVDPALSAICSRAMAMQPADRYCSVRRLANEIERFLADEPVEAYSEPFLRRSQRWLRKHPRLAGSVAATLIAAMLSAGLIAGVVSRSNRQLAEKNIELAQLNVHLEEARDEAVAAKNLAEKRQRQAEEARNRVERAFQALDMLAMNEELVNWEAAGVDAASIQPDEHIDSMSLGLKIVLEQQMTILKYQSYDLAETRERFENAQKLFEQYTQDPQDTSPVELALMAFTYAEMVEEFSKPITPAEEARFLTVLVDNELDALLLPDLYVSTPQQLDTSREQLAKDARTLALDALRVSLESGTDLTLAYTILEDEEVAKAFSSLVDDPDFQEIKEKIKNSDRNLSPMNTGSASSTSAWYPGKLLIEILSMTQEFQSDAENPAAEWNVEDPRATQE